MKAERGEEASEQFGASRGWFMRFKERSHLHNIKVQDEAERACRSCSKLSRRSKIINKGGYTKQQIVNVAETASY